MELIGAIHVLYAAVDSPEDCKPLFYEAFRLAWEVELPFVEQTLKECFPAAAVSSHKVTLTSIHQVLDKIEIMHCCEPPNNDTPHFVIFNLCAGLDCDGIPGFSVVREIERRKMAFTGGSSEFFAIGDLKPTMKHFLQAANVPTAEYLEIQRLETVEDDILAAERKMTYPMIVKLSKGYASFGIDHKSVVETRQEAIAQAKALLNSELNCGSGVFVEKYLAGNEFTVLVDGDAQRGVRTFPAFERIFNSKLLGGYKHRHLTQNSLVVALADTDNTEEHLVLFKRADDSVQQRLQELTRRAYMAVKGSGYGRADIRSDDLANTNFYVLEVNSVPFLAQNAAVYQIVQSSGVEFSEFLRQQVGFAIDKWKSLRSNDKI